MASARVTVGRSSQNSGSSICSRARSQSKPGPSAVMMCYQLAPSPLLIGHTNRKEKGCQLMAAPPVAADADADGAGVILLGEAVLLRAEHRVDRRGRDLKRPAN